jgi:hypothetical protein
MEKFKEEIKKVSLVISESKTLVKVLYILVFLIIAKTIFFAGMMVGFHKASFGHDWGENYNENFIRGRGFPGPNGLGMMDSFGMMNSFPNAHGATGKIIKIELPNIIVEGKDDTEKVVSLDSDTKIQNGRDVVAEEDLALDDFVVVIGVPNDKGVIEAKLIRVIPKPEFLK